MKRLGANSSGFTLVEILVVVFIIGLLATIVGVSVSGRGDEAKRVAAKANLKEIESALHLYKLDNGFYPTTAEGLVALIEPPSTAKRWNEDGYLNQSSIPQDPWGFDYIYESNGRKYSLRSLGDDGEVGGDGPSADLDSRDLTS
ncbi:MAG: type II secretion system major pseudopilin GspG [Candidatus Binatia bacterium]